MPEPSQPPRPFAKSRLPGFLIGACALILGVWFGGCERKAPGPEQCHRIALRVVGVHDARLLRSPQVKNAVDEVMIECLTQPYDKELLRCIEQVAHPRACYASFAQRRIAERSK